MEGVNAKAKKRQGVSPVPVSPSSSRSSSSSGSGSSSRSSSAGGHGHQRHHQQSSHRQRQHAHDFDTKLNYLMQKVLAYSHKRKTTTPDDLTSGPIARNASSKYAKYLNQLRNHTYLSPLAASGHGDFVEVKLRKAGVLEAMMMVLRNVVDSFKQVQQVTADDVADDEEIDSDLDYLRKEAEERISILSNSLSVLSNCFARDPTSREEAFKYSIPLTLHKILKLIPKNENRGQVSPEVQAKALKCIGNLATDKQCRLQTLTRGVATTILNSIRTFCKNQRTSATVTVPADHKLYAETESITPLLQNAVRALRVLCADPESKTLLWRMNALVILGDLLVFNTDEPASSTTSRNETHNATMETLKALNVLSVRFRIAPPEALYEFKLHGEPILQKLVNILKHSNDTKILSLVTHTLTNLSSIKELVPRLINMKIYDVVFIRLSEEDYISVMDDFVRLLQGLLMDDSVICKYLLPYSPQIFATIKILRLPQLEKYHHFVLTLFQNLLGGGLETLVENGLVDLLEELLQTIYQNCTFDSFSQRISTLDGTNCPVHTRGSGCGYIPLYRCTSPTYLEMKEEIKGMLQSRAFIEQANASTPKHGGWASPAHSWSSTSGFVSDSFSEGYSPPTSGHASPVSSTDSDDESIALTSEDMLYAEHRAEFSDAEMDEHQHEEQRNIQQSAEGEKEEVEEPSTSSDIVPHKKRRIEYESECQAKTEKMVLIIDILKNITFLKPFRPTLLRFTPTFMNILCDGKMNCIRYKVQENPDNLRDPTVKLNKQLFFGSHRMLQEFFADIYNYGFILEKNLIPLLHKLILLGDDGGKKEEDTILAKNTELEKCNELLKNLLVVLSGETNQTLGWRAGFMNQSLLANSTSIIKDKVAIAIPLLHQVDCFSFRGYQLKSGAWTTLFKILEDMEYHDGPLFQDCITSISTLCKTLGLKWTEHEAYGARGQLKSASTNYRRSVWRESLSDNDENSISIQFDDGNELLTNKKILADASPVFSAMFDGRFLEGNQPKVKLKNTSKDSMELLVDELVADSTPTASTSDAYTRDPGVKTLFELLSLSTQYMLEDIQTRTLNTIIATCLCPYSAADIYKNVVNQLYQRVGPHHADLEANDLTHLILKYLLVGPGLGPNLQYKGFKKIFDLVEPQIVLADLKSLFESFSSNVLSVPPPLRRNSVAKHKQQLMKFQ